MLNKKNNSYCIFGNPVNHSKSPFLHHLFAKQIGIMYSYNPICVPIHNFTNFVFNFFNKSGNGANVTSPFKLEAYLLSDKLTRRAKISKSVNTLKRINNSEILGDNTDGIGLLSDLIRLNFIKKNYSILILGAGGAVRGVLFPLLSFGCSVFILNRTAVNAKNLVSDFIEYGKIEIFNIKNDKVKTFDLVINAIPRNIISEKDFFPRSFVSSRTFFYDMNYGITRTSFIDWCLKIGGMFFSDGIGMLVFQAAHSCFLWHHRFPLVNSIIKKLEKK